MSPYEKAKKELDKAKNNFRANMYQVKLPNRTKKKKLS